MLGYSQHEGMIYDLHVLLAREFGEKLPEFSYDRIIPNTINVTTGSGDWRKIVNILTKFYSKGTAENRYDVSHLFVNKLYYYYYKCNYFLAHD